MPVLGTRVASPVQGNMARPSENVLVHFYRGELRRSDLWRARLDTTTNWALTSAAAVITVSLSSRKVPHVAVLAGAFLVSTFLVVEARRYRYYDLWIRRVRLLEAGFILPTLRDEPIDEDALRELAELVSRPRLGVSWVDALGLRLRRTYAPIFLVLLLTWIAKLAITPTFAHQPLRVIARAHIGPIPGAVVWAATLTCVGLGVWLYVRSFMRPMPPGELRPRRAARPPLGAIFRRRGA